MGYGMELNGLLTDRTATNGYSRLPNLNSILCRALLTNPFSATRVSAIVIANCSCAPARSFIFLFLRITFQILIPRLIGSTVQHLLADRRHADSPTKRETQTKTSQKLGTDVVVCCCRPLVWVCPFGTLRT